MGHISLTRLPPLEPLRTFEAVARSGSFSAAALSLHLTHGAVSRQIARLETWAGLKLFHRRARGVVLTPDGERLLQRTHEAFSALADTTDRWRDQRGAAIVRLSAVASVAGRWLMPRLTALESIVPAVQVSLIIDNSRQDLEAENIDLAIRCGRGGLPGRRSLRLFEEHCFPVAAPELASRLQGGRPDQLLQEVLIHDSDASGWRAWFAEASFDYRPKPTDRRFEDYNLVIEAALNGLGVALARPPLAQGLVDRGDLVRVSATTAVNPVSYWLDRSPRPMREASRRLALRIAAAASVSDGPAEAFVADTKPSG